MPASPFFGCAVLMDGKTAPSVATVRSNAFFILLIFISKVAQPGFSMRTSISRIVRFSCPRLNKFASRPGPAGIVGFWQPTPEKHLFGN